MLGKVIPDGKAGLRIPTYGFEGIRPSTMPHYSGGQLRLAALPAISGTVLYVNAVAAVLARRG